MAFAIMEHSATEAVRTAAQAAGQKAAAALSSPAAGGAEHPVTAQGLADFGGIAQLATAIEKLNRSGRYLIMSVAFLAVAAGAATAGVAASA